MNDPEDVIRSLRRYVALMLGSPPWSVRAQRTRVADEERPVAVVEGSGPLSTPFARTARVRQGDQQKARPFTVVCYPVVVWESAAEAAHGARELVTLLDAGFSRGLVTDDVPAVNIGGPFRVPIWDYAGVPIVGASRAGPADPYSYANVDPSFNVRDVQDPLDELRFTVVASLRLTWWQGGRVPPAAPVATSVPGGWEPVHP